MMVINDQKTFGFYKSFFLLFIAVSLLILLFQRITEGYVNNLVWLAQAFFLFIMILTHLVSGKGLNRKDEFHIYYMASMGIRFLLSLIFIFIVFFYSDQDPVIFVVAFFILYLVYTSFEIYFLLRNLRTDFKNDGTNKKTI